jgi:hypothetical protein
MTEPGQVMLRLEAPTVHAPTVPSALLDWWRRRAAEIMCFCVPLLVLLVVGSVLIDEGTLRVIDTILATCVFVITICSAFLCLAKRQQQQQQQSVAANSTAEVQVEDARGSSRVPWSMPFLDRPCEDGVCPICTDSLVREGGRVRVWIRARGTLTAVGPSPVSVLIKEDALAQCTLCGSVFHSGCVDDMNARLWMADRCPMCRQQGIYSRS